MVRPKSKESLWQQAEENFDKLQNTINQMTLEQQLEPFGFTEDFLMTKKESHWRRDGNLRDVLIHLYEWHQLFLKWESANSQGQSIPFLPEPYNWKNYSQMNVEFVTKHQETSLSEAKELLATSHQQMMAIIKRYSNEQLFEKQQYSWTGSTTLGSYVISATSSHYDWANKKLKQQLKLLKRK
ncbi:ClbS/DfsB family four-helix bundle protein [Vagococcus xieshaowenii]|uniref:ClbS/DfsB family four-helix bundle protein n=1 Tax=Vagococcus xieshaowenii TaxID=2562451 RepID=A0AAJ5EFQ6_9ENTE|nr:ClbS/DfsB family four-helix bundle protein [Vagococcus xieshaowenii]QCA28617.1 ClbS/DfsB family four-helix bundle protein [Vagococcus xieshaowenii]TFZ40575.1 ClbS/DfsB family four-helix bundle protein [Vagococcus xieshaowenii]